MPDALDPLVIAGGGGANVIVRFAVPVPVAFEALTVAVKGPNTVAVPEIRPLPALTFSPAGSPLAPKLVGLLLAVIW